MSRIAQTFKIELSANESRQNILEGTRLSQAPNDANYDLILYATASSDDVQHELGVDNDTPVREGPVSAQDRVPIVPDDRVEAVAIEGGSQLFLKANNTDSSAQTYYARVELRPRR